MATRGTIALEFADGTVQSVYCHYDNYLEGTGKILQEHYMDPFKVRTLIDLGDLSSLGAEIGEKQEFDSHTSWSNTCLFYGRDRGDADVGATKFDNINHYVQENGHQEYDYILRQVDGKPVWFVRSYATHDDFIPLEKAFVAKKEYTE